MTLPGPLTFHWDGHWREDAACRHHDTELFFPTLGEPLDEARAICATCPVIDRCLEEGIANREVGVWGGLSDKERKILMRKRRAEGLLPKRTRPRPPCGTDRGHRAHLRNDEPSCIACQEAHALAQRRQDSRVDPTWRHQCGSNAGWMAHYRAIPQERPCQPCVTAHGIANARRKHSA